MVMYFNNERQHAVKNNQRKVDLEQRMEKILSDYPKINDFLYDSLLRRCQYPGWLKNPVIQTVLLNRDYALRECESILGCIENENIKRLKVRVKGEQRDYDSQILDAWVEVLACNYLYKQGHSNIQVISKGKSGPKADVISEKAGKIYITEATNVHATDGFSRFVWSEIHAMYIENPSAFNKHFHVEQEGFEDDLTDEDLHELEVIFEIIRSTNGTKSVYEREWKVDDKIRVITVEISGQKFFITEMGSTYWENPDYVASRIIPATKRLLSKIEEKVSQLTKADPQHKYEHVIFMQWSKPEWLGGLDGQVKVVKEILVTFTKRIDKKLSLVFHEDNNEK